MICKNCNREIPNDSEYCSFCGNIVQSVISTGISSDLSKGYTYLELKQWKDAEQFFRNAIIDGDNKGEAYIGKMLAKYKTDSIENLVSSGKKFSSDDDFKLAIKYADPEYAEHLKKCALSGAKKSKKRTIIVSSICAFVIVIALLSYFVLIPLNRISNYENLLADGKAQEAVKSYTSSKWFEYDQKAKDLFYESGLKLVETKDYKNAESCFEITNGYTDNEKYLNYCKAQNLLADDDLESYNYFTDLGDFLDSKEILNTNKYFVMVNKLQGEWEQGEYIVQNTNKGTNSTSKKSRFEDLDSLGDVSPEAEEEYKQNMKMTISGILVNRGCYEYKLSIDDKKMLLVDVEGDHHDEIKIIGDNTIEYDDYKWTKVK